MPEKNPEQEAHDTLARDSLPTELLKLPVAEPTRSSVLALRMQFNGGKSFLTWVCGACGVWFHAAPCPACSVKS